MQRTDIQALRGISVLAVVGFHLFPQVFPNGYLGVDVFFVISGFVVTPMILKIFQQSGKKSSNIFNFYIRRFFRLAPAFASTLIFFIVPIYLFGDADDLLKYLKQTISTLFLLGNIGALFFSGNYFNPNPNPFIHTWSLSVEEQFYLLLPVLYLVARNKKLVYKKMALAFVISVSIVLFLFPRIPFTILAIFEPQSSHLLDTEIPGSLAFYSTPGRLWEFLLGSCVFLLISKSKKIFANNKTWILLQIVLLTLLFNRQSMGHSLATIAVVLVASGLLIFTQKFENGNLLFAFLKWTGDRSYSVYLVHMPLAYLAMYSPLVQAQNPLRREIAKVIALFATLILGALQYRFIEKRYRLSGSPILQVKRSEIVSGFVKFFSIPLAVYLCLYLLTPHILNSVKGSDLPSYAGDLKSSICEPMTRFSSVPCSLHRNSRSTDHVLLIGDSHAMQYLEVFKFLGVKTNSNVTFYGDFDSLNLVSKFSRELGVSKLYISKYWKRDRDPRSDSVKILSEIKTLNIDSVVIGQNPVFPDATLFMNHRMLMSSRYQAPTEFKVSSMDKNSLLEGLVVLETSANLDLKHLDVWSVFCDNQICSRYEKGTWLYFDDDHLSLTGAAKLVSLIDDFRY
jgi:peptidoglycan/LPS O-acetylase OafA/YrhL